MCFVWRLSSCWSVCYQLWQRRKINSSTRTECSIRYIDVGAGEPVVLIHGYTNFIERNWIETGVLPNLAKDHRVIALDLRGHGKSDKPHDPKAYGTELGLDIVRLLDHLNIKRAHIVGYSLGGIITAKLLTTSPDRFITITLVASSGRRNWTAQAEVTLKQQLLSSKAECPIGRSSSPPHQAINLRRLRTPFARVHRRSSLITIRLAHAALTRAGRELVVTDSQMAAVQVPALAIVGTADPAVEGVKTLKAAWPELQMVTVEGATHWGDRGILIRPEFVNSLRQFIAAHPGTSQK